MQNKQYKQGDVVLIHYGENIIEATICGTERRAEQYWLVRSEKFVCDYHPYDTIVVHPSSIQSSNISIRTK